MKKTNEGSDILVFVAENLEESKLLASISKHLSMVNRLESYNPEEAELKVNTMSFNYLTQLGELLVRMNEL